MYNITSFMRKIIWTLAFFVLLPVLVFAQAGSGGTICDPAKGKICNPINQTTIDGFLQTLLVGVIKIGIPIVALAIIYAGFLYVTARGNSEKLETAHKALTFSIIGAAILLGSWALAQLISETVLNLG